MNKEKLLDKLAVGFIMLMALALAVAILIGFYQIGGWRGVGAFAGTIAFFVGMMWSLGRAVDRDLL